MDELKDYDPSQFKGILELLIPSVIEEIVKNRNVSEDKAFELLYLSRLYYLLEEEGTKLWHLSPLTLANLLNEELETGKITFPEAA
ncbi:hypothetical protein RsTz2092_11540 [Deferribacterales bacterium RsTz2092]|nr:hypothetical protein AGMMS49941_10690 [Deferribacterales bacterium]